MKVTKYSAKPIDQIVNAEKKDEAEKKVEKKEEQ
jgi:hypothetical protein